MKLGRLRFHLVVGALTLAGLALAPVALAGQPAKPAAPAGCDSTRPGSSYGPGGTSPAGAGAIPCLTYTFPDFGEGGIVATAPVRLSNGAIAPGAVMHGGTYPPHPTFVSEGLARSVDGGAHWANVMLAGNSLEIAGNRDGADNGFYQDPATHRLFYYSDGSFEGPVSTVEGALNIAYSDDNGETWVNNPGPPLQFFPVSDATVMFGGPPRTPADQTALSQVGYPDVMYLCGQSRCFKSLDGGINFVEIKDTTGTDQAGANGALLAGPTGVLYGATLRTSSTSSSSPSQQLNVSTDDGTTWSKTAGMFPTGFTPACARPSGYGNLSADKDGNLYLGGVFNNQLAITSSTNGGASWVTPIQLQMPQVAGTDVGLGLCAFDSDWYRPGHLTAAYVGYSTGNLNGPHHGYLTVTRNLFASTPIFTTVQIDSNRDPLFPNGAPCNLLHESATAPCAPHSASRLDYISVTFNPADGIPWALYAKDVCTLPACADKTDPNDPQGSLNYSRDYDYTNFLGAVGTMTNP